MMKIHTIAAGGGSILKYQDGRYQVGPDSAGADQSYFHVYPLLCVFLPYFFISEYQYNFNL